MATPIYIIFGRFQPPTVGHESLFHTALERAHRRQGKVAVFVSQTQDKKNPLSYEDKVSVIKKSVPDLIIGPKTARTPAEALTWAFEHGYRDITLIVGEDREAGFDKMAGSWQKSEDPKQTAVVRVESLPRQGNMDMSKVSGTVARKYAQQGDAKNLQKILISGARDAKTVRRFIEIIQGKLGKLQEKDMRMVKHTRKLSEDVDPQVARVMERILSDSSWMGEPSEVTTDTSDNADTPTTPSTGGSLDPEERVPEDTPNNKSIMVMYPERRLKYDTINKAKEQQGDDRQPHHIKLQRAPQTRR